MEFKIEGKRINLRKLRISDAKFIWESAKDKEITKYTLVVTPPFMIERIKKFIKESQKEMKKKIAYRFAIELKKTKEILGMVSFTDINWKNKNANVGFWLSKKYQGKGLTREALSLVLNFGFKKLKLERIQARVLDKNIRAQKILESSGFKYEGKMRKKTFFRNRWYDDLIYGILREEYRPHD